MTIKGFQGTSLLDYPGRISSLVFFSGCNLSCPYCHNPDLIVDRPELPELTGEEVLAELRSRRSFIDGVVVTGGEPTLHEGLADFVRELKGLGLLVKLDTNGLRPRVLDRLLAEDLLDFIALDLKTSPERYGELHKGPVGLANLEESIRLVLEKAPAFELRTTCVPGLVGERDIHRLGSLLQGAPGWVLQQFVPAHAWQEDCRGLVPYTVEELRGLADIARGYVGEVQLRGV